MRIEWATPCRYVENQPAGASIIGAGADAYFVPQVPAAVPVLFAVRIVGHPDELDGQTKHAVVCRLYNPAGELRGEQRAEISAEGTVLVPGYSIAAILPIGTVIDAQEYGTYGVEFEMDENPYNRVAIHILAPQTG